MLLIQDLFLYFAKFPRLEGVKTMFTRGDSDFCEYQLLLDQLDNLKEHSLVPELENYVYGQSLEDLQQRVDRLFGSWLYADYGEFQMNNAHGIRLEVTQRIAVTVALKLSQNADMVERMIASDRALKMLTEIQGRILADADAGRLCWLSRSENASFELVPFVASELSSYGWTLLLDAVAPDTLGIHSKFRQLNRPW